MTTEIFVDYDGTITDLETFDVLARRFAGEQAWRALEEGLEQGSLSIRDALQAEAGLVRITLDQADALLAGQMRIDPSFAPFVAACEARGMRLRIVSSGVEPLIERALARHGLTRIPVVANALDVTENGWRIRFRDASPNGNDKAALVRATRNSGARVIFIGDGRSDYDAALEADRAFAKRGGFLEAFLRERNVPFEPFADFSDVTAALSRAA